MMTLFMWAEWSMNSERVAELGKPGNDLIKVLLSRYTGRTLLGVLDRFRLEGNTWA